MKLKLARKFEDNLPALKYPETHINSEFPYKNDQIDASVFPQQTLLSIRRAPSPSRIFRFARLSCWLSRLRCADAADGERLCGNRSGFLSNSRALDSFARASER
jgi:hypothetical protein